MKSKIFFIFMCIQSLFANEKIVVIGGGLAGLSAAYQLQQQGRDVELYEARERVGGRVLSVKIAGSIAELGGWSLNDGGDALSMRGLIAEMGLEISDTHLIGHHFMYFDRGELRLAPRYPRKVDLEEIETFAKTAHSMANVVDAFIPKDHLLHQMITMRFGAFEGAYPEKLAPLYLKSMHRFLQPRSDDDVYTLSSVKGGNSLLTNKLAEKLGERVHLGHQLRMVEKKKNGYLLSFANGQQCEADILILAMPCSVYEDISFGEGVIPPEKLEAIQSVCYGTNAKILVPFKDEKTHWPLLINERALGYRVQGLLTLYYTGESSRFSEENLEETVQAELPMVIAGLGTAFPTHLTLASDKVFAEYGESIVGYSWPNDPFVKGSYSYIAPGQEALLRSLTQIDGEWVKELFSPIDGTLYFAGEHTSILLDAPGTMEAASESGERAARMINKRV